MTNKPSSRPVTPSPYGHFFTAAASLGMMMMFTVIYLSHANIEKNKRLEQAYTEINEAHTLQAALDFEYQQAMSELEEYKSANSELNAIIEAQMEELDARKAKIEVLLVDSKKLKEVRQELESLQSQWDKACTEIVQLQAQNSGMKTYNIGHPAVSAPLFTHGHRVEGMQRNGAKAVLVSQYQNTSKSEESRAVIKVKNIQVDGIQIKPNGKTPLKKSAKKVDQLKICFTTTANETVKPGIEQFFVRVMNPSGETLAMESLGSGAIKTGKTGKKVRYTQFSETEYFNDEQDLCLLWSPDMAFQSGKYQVEVYNKGFLAGTDSFELK